MISESYKKTLKIDKNVLSIQKRLEYTETCRVKLIKIDKNF